MRNRCLCIVVGWLSYFMAAAQVLSSASVYVPRNLYTIFEGDDVAGYFWCYSNKAISPTEHEYLIEVMDFAMRKTNEFKLNGPVASRLINVASNGSSFFFQFKGDAFDSPRIMISDFKGNILANEKIGMAIGLGKLRDDFYPVEHGFLFKQTAEADRIQYDFVNNTGKRVWSLTPAGEEVDWAKHEVRFCNDAMIALSDYGVDHLRIFSMVDGHEIIKLPLLQQENKLYPTSFFATGDTIHVVGQYILAEKDKTLPLKPDGLFAMALLKDGQIKYTALKPWSSLWRDDLPDLEINDPKLKDYVWIHQFMHDGKTIHAIGEIFDAKLDLVNGKSADFGVKQYVGMTFSSALELDTICVFTLDSTFGTSRSADYHRDVHHRVNTYRSGATNFEYSVQSASGPVLHSVFHTDVQVGKGSARQTQLEAIGIGRDGKWRHSALGLSPFANEVIILPSRAGYVLYYEVFVIDQYTLIYQIGLKKFDL